MNKRTIGIFFVLLLTICLKAEAQGVKSVRINEVMITNETNFLDDYGVHSAWIELYNSSFASVNVESCFLTNDKNNPRMYPIPKEDVQTEMPPRQHLLFWSDGLPSRGTFHLSFKLDPTKENWIGLYDANGITLIDEVTIPAGTLLADQSYAREDDGSLNWVVKGQDNQHYVTPSSNNMTKDSNSKIESFKVHDGSGFLMAIMAMIIVFSCLLLLATSFKIIGKIAIWINKKNQIKSKGISNKNEQKETDLGNTPGEIYAAIGMALHEYQDNVHDIEDTVLTINKVKRNYSPWSSKIYTLTETPRKH